MTIKDPTFEVLKVIFNAQGKRIYMVGGAVRDLILGRPFNDYDFVTDATPKEMKEIIPDADFTFSRYGSVKFKVGPETVDITTLRSEKDYKDFRHPSSIKFVNTPEEDYLRRDFTINALYLDEDYNLLDFCGGLSDLQNHVIRFIGEPEIRVKEDPLRIIRAERFAYMLGFNIEENTKAAIENGKVYLNELNPKKVEDERNKMFKQRID